MRKWADAEAEQEQLRERAAHLPDEERRAFYREVREKLKDPDTYAAANWFLFVGLHHFYLGRWGRGLMDIAAVVGGLALFAVEPYLGAALVAAVFVVELAALFRSQTIVQDWNNRIYREVLRRYEHE